MERRRNRIDWHDAYRPGNHRHIENEPAAIDPSSPPMGRDGRAPTETDMADELKAVIQEAADSFKEW